VIRIRGIFLVLFLVNLLLAGQGALETYARAASNLLTCFTAEEQSGFVRSFDDKEIEGKGKAIAELTSSQQEAFGKLLKSVLRKQGLKKIDTILTADTTNSTFKLYFYGNPETDSLWAWQINGRYLDLYFSVNDSGYLSVTPSNWIEKKGISGPQEKPVLFYENALAVELLKSLESFKKYQAVISPVMPARFAPGCEGLQETDGLLLKEMTWDQMILFIRLINAHLGNFKREIARRYWDQIIDHDFKQLRFAWYGSLSPEQPHAYSIHGPSIIILYYKSSDQTYVYMNSKD
jgi:hypothetical protein